MNQIENLHILFNGDNAQVLSALRAKQSWINHKYLIPGNVNKSYDKKGKEHYDFIEALYDGCFIFHSFNLELKGFSKEENDIINANLAPYAKLTLYSDFDEKIDVPFWIEYDFNKLELSQYRQLFPNFYFAIPLRLLNVKLSNKNLIYECMKCAISGETLQNSIILSKNDLFDLKYHCPIISKIYYKKDIDNELLETLKMIGTKYKVELEELDNE